jgi:hypothetical protein
VTGRSVARLELGSLLLGLPLVYFSAAFALAALGIVQANQLPLVDFKRVGQMHGRGRAFAVVWATASQCFLWLLENLPAAASVLIGVAAAATFAAFVFASQWTRITETVWTRSVAAPPADPGTADAPA